VTYTITVSKIIFHL